MKIQNIKTDKITPSIIAGKNSAKKSENLAKTFTVENLTNPLYYKDCFINKDLTVSFKGSSSNDLPPENREEFIKRLLKTNKYSQDEINEILKMIDKIIEQDPWDEVDEIILLEMFDSLAKSSDNSSIQTMQSITERICSLQQDDDYFEINPICKGISAICDNISYSNYYFKRIFTGSYDGILNCDNTNLVYELCDYIKKSFKNVNTKKYAQLIYKLSSHINMDDEKLQEELSTIKGLSQKYGYKDSELLDGLLLYYNENIPLDIISLKLEKRKITAAVYQNLKDINIPDEIYFEKVFAKIIEELSSRGYTPEQIADLLSANKFCNKILSVEGIANANPMIMADFIESIPSVNNYDYDLMVKYTKSSSLFNDLLSECGGDLDKLQKGSNYEDDLGYKYNSEEAKTAIIELTSFLNTQHLKKDLSVYRGEGIGVLNQLILKNGDLLGDAINNAVNKNDIARLEEISAEITGSLIVQPRFMSSSYSKEGAKNYIKHEGGILWQIDAPKGASAIYADPFNIEHGLECEILFNRNSSMIIKDAKFENGIYTIYADLVQTHCDN